MHKISKIFSKNFFIGITFYLFAYEILAMVGDVYEFSWLDPDKEIFVLQNRKFRKVNRLFVSAGYGKTTSGPFIDSTGFQFRTGYFAFENYGFEFIYAVSSGKENNTAYSVRNQGGKGSVPFSRIVDNYMGGIFLWSPFYAKINTFNSIIYLDWFIGLGLGKLDETNNILELEGAGDKTLTKESHTGLLLETTLQFYITKHIGARLDLVTFRYSAVEGVSGATENVAYYNYDLTFSLNYIF